MPSLQSLAKALRAMDDFRRIDYGNFTYSLSSVLTCAFCATMAGCCGARAISDFMTEWFDPLNKLVGLPHGVPSHDTINRVLISVDSLYLGQILREWAGVVELHPHHLQVDGKTICGSKENGKNVTHIVTVFAGEFAASILETKVFDKQNEISAFESVLLSKQIDFSGKVVTGDAMYCQKSFCRTITESGGDWLFVVKNNQPNLYKNIETFWAGTKEGETRVVPISGHGRKGTKTIRFSSDIDWLAEDHDFAGLSCIAEITTDVIEKGQRKVSKQYLIGSLKTLEELFTARSKHWSIESMHWILDTAFEEDKCTSRKGNAPLNLNIFRKIGFFFLSLAMKKNLFKDCSIRRLMKRCAMKFSNLQRILSLA